MNKQVKHSYKGINQDITKSKLPNEYYFDGRNIRIVSTNSQSTGSITNEKGNEFILTIPKPSINYTTKQITYDSKILNYTTNEINPTYGLSLDQVIIGHSVTKNCFVIFTTDNSGFDCVWTLEYDTNDLTLKYLRNLNFSTNNNLLVVSNFENDSVDKVYWVDGIHQMRFLNLNHSIANKDNEELIDLPKTTIEMVSSFALNQPKVTKIISGGTHTAGMIQYAYNLYKVNSSQTKISPFSELVSLDKDTSGGGKLNEVVSKTPLISISNIDKNYTNIRVYSIKYTSYGQIPVISLIEDVEIPNTRSLEMFDDGISINTISLEEFIFLGSDIIIPKNINSKHNRMFFAGYKEYSFDLDLDCKAYSFNSSHISTIHSELKEISGVVSSNRSIVLVTDNDYDNPLLDKFDCVNLDYNTYKYQKSSLTLGGEGKYLKYELTSNSNNDLNNRYFKDDEIYRLGIQFYNIFGQISLPKWVADFKSKSGNLKKEYNTLKVTLKPEFYTWLNNSSNFVDIYDKPVGYKILIAERTSIDRTIVANGLLSTMMINDKTPNDGAAINYRQSISDSLPKIPSFFMRNVMGGATSNYLALAIGSNCLPIVHSWHLTKMNIAQDFKTEVFREDMFHDASFYQYSSMVQLFSPETVFNESFSPLSGLKFKLKGAYKNSYNASIGKEINISNGAPNALCNTIHGVSPFFAPHAGFNTNGIFDNGLISSSGGSDPNAINLSQFYRLYGKSSDTFNQDTILVYTDPLTSIVSNNISYNITNNAIKTVLNYNNNDNTLDYTYKVIVTYEITPSVGYSSVNYNAYIKENALGSTYESSLNVNGFQVISYEYDYVLTSLNTENKFTFENILQVLPDNDFIADVNVRVDYIETDNLTSTDVFTGNCTSSLNNMNINVTVVNGDDIIIEPMTPVSCNVYGTPELTEKSGIFKSYNNDPKYRYVNSLQSIYTDGIRKAASGVFYENIGICERRITSANNYLNQNVTFVLGDDNPSINSWDRPTLESLFNDSGIAGYNFGVIGELVKSDLQIYLGNIYGGNTWEDKKRTNYIEIGEYNSVNNGTLLIDSPGDTFVNNFKFERVFKTETDINNQCIIQFTEIIEVPCESTVNLRNRSDLSFSSWDSKFQPSFEDYHNYNKVYSQSSNLVLRKDLNYNFKKINNFDMTVISSKFKTSGELIDNWTDIQQNEVITMDGKNGKINALISFKDQLYVFQDKAMSFLSINPRVQVQGADGYDIQLGTGKVLNEYRYVSTESGALNKFGIVTSPNNIYYYDNINKTIMIFNGKIEELSDLKGIHSFLENNIDLETLKTDNPVLHKGISGGFNNVNNDMFMTFHQQNKESFTISFNELSNSFTSFHDYKPSRYLSRGNNFITTSPNNKSIYQQDVGEYGNFYGTKYDSYVTLLVNPEADLDTVLDNIMYKSEVYLNDIDQPDKTLSHLRLYNEYQDSGIIPLEIGRNKNLRRKFRDWNAILPRNNNTRQRIRNPWVYLTLKFQNNENCKLILHDVVISYTV